MLNIHDTATWLMKSGFVIHPTKSVLIPTQEINFVGFCLNPTRMEDCLPQGKSLAIQEGCDSLTANPHPTIREVARVIGSLVASFPAAAFGKLYYRSLEMDKIKALSHAKGNFDQKMSLSPTSIHELQWWLQNIVNQKKTASGCCPDKVLTTDASNEGWGAALQGTTLTGGGGAIQRSWDDHAYQC